MSILESLWLGRLASKLFNVDGWACLITGGGTGIGLMCAQALAANGARVYITGRWFEVLENAAKEHSPKEGNGKIIPFQTQPTPHPLKNRPLRRHKDSLQSLVSKLSSLEKHLNLLVCNAGISGPKADPSISSSASKISQELWSKESFSDWSSVFTINVSSVYFTTVALLHLLQACSHAHPEGHSHMAGNVIVISSMSGIMRHAQKHFSYSASKGATVHLTKLMSTEFEKTGVRVNSIAPGYFPSEMTTGESDEKNKSELSDEKVKGHGHKVPAERSGHDEEMAMAVLFLARDRFSTIFHPLSYIPYTHPS
ncbi:short chain dehydrogenase [Pseudoneurospora amorphoporcata]|uniref:Short chain dehydrogenase n=1 Tax=Pseudoneurospora amorphoporcata TaxID=241081 RepID=A0AAN6NL82_9PEZI|nr:short chain dehydrogenase [Pseudoneurospora amorphoporcata]